MSKTEKRKEREKFLLNSTNKPSNRPTSKMSQVFTQQTQNTYTGL